jgi:hypothetical protein
MNENARRGTESRCHCTVLRKASRRISQLYDAALAPSGLKITQRAILAQIGRSEPATVGALAEALVMDAGCLAHTLCPRRADKSMRPRTASAACRSERPSKYWRTETEASRADEAAG